MRSKVINSIYQAIGDVNKQRLPDQQLPAQETTVLMGDKGALDSLGVLNLLVATEERLRSEAGIDVDVAATLMQGDRELPPATVGELADLIVTLSKRP